MTGANMRPTSSRSPPFLVIGLMVALCILAFNYWSLSSKTSDLSQQQSDLSRQYETLQIEFRSVSDKHGTVQKHASDLATKLADQEDKCNQLQSSSKQKDEQIQSLNDEKTNLNNQLNAARSNLESASKDLERMKQEKNVVDDELNKVKAELQQKQNAPPVCDKKACRDPIREVVGQLAGSVAKSAISGALKSNVEVMEMSADLLQGPDAQKGDGQQNAGGQQQQQQQQQNQQPGNQVVRRVPNVVGMQQAGAGAPFQGGGGVGLLSDTDLTWQASRQLSAGSVRNQNNRDPNFPQNHPQHFPIDANGMAVAQTNMSEHNHPDPNNQEIVAQNIPGGDGVVNNDLTVSNNNNNNSPAAQEDLEGQPALDLPEDEMDRQAVANQKAEGMVDSLHDQLQDLSANDVHKNELDYDNEEEETKKKAEDNDNADEDTIEDAFEQPNNEVDFDERRDAEQ